jgi:hypothetical protein
MVPMPPKSAKRFEQLKTLREFRERSRLQMLKPKRMRSSDSFKSGLPMRKRWT